MIHLMDNKGFQFNSIYRRYFVATSTPLVANVELNKHGGDAEKKTEASFVRLDYATEDK